MKGRHLGFAVPVVLLIGAVILVSVVTAASVTALGSRINVSDEKTAYQALLAAESGINTFLARANTISRYNDQLTIAKLNAWLASNSLASANLGGGAGFTLEIVAVDSITSKFTLRSIGTLANGRASVLQDVQLNPPAGRLRIRVPAALTSYPRIAINGAKAVINGLSGSSWNGLISGNPPIKVTANAAVPAAKGATFNITVGDASLFGAGEYVQINNVNYGVNAVNTSTLTLHKLAAGGPSSIGINSPVDLVSSAVVSINSSDSSKISASDTTQFIAGDKVYIANSSNPSQPFVGTVAGVDDASKTLTINWTGASPSFGSTVLEGTPIRRDVLGAISHGTISDPKGNILPTKKENADLPSPFDASGNLLFQQTFGMTPEQMKSIADRVTNNTVPSMLNDEIVYVDNFNSSSNMQFCGSGILIIDSSVSKAEFKSNSSGCVFNGLVYVMGNYKENGNREIEGAVVVEGTYEDDTEDTDVDGNGDKVSFNPLWLRKISGLASPLQEDQFSWVPSTWRQQ